MPGWPTVGRTDDQHLVEALRRADTTAPASLYDSYGERLADYAFSLLGDREAAAEAVHDALVTAQGRVEHLREPGRLRAWLYALVRLRCAPGVQARGGRQATAAPAADAHDDPGERELAALVHEAMGELGAQEREVLELSLRHDLGTGEAGAVLGLSSRQVAARLGRARDHLENAAAAVVLAKVGRAHCPDLSAMVDCWEGPLTTMLRRRLSAHIGRCEVCVERRDRHVSAGRLLDLVPLAYPPLSLRRRVIETCVNPELRETRAAVLAGNEHFDRAGFPVAAPRRAGGRRTAAPAQRRRRRPRRGPVLLAAACVLAACGAAVVMGGQVLAGGAPKDFRAAPGSSAAPGTRPALITTEPAPEPGPDPSEDGPGDPGERRGDPERDEDPPTPTAGPGTPTAAPLPSRAAPARRSTAARPRPSRTAPRRPVTGRLTVSCPADIGQGAGRIRLSARGAAVSWSATTSGGLNAQPSRGRLAAGAGTVIWVTAHDPSQSGAGRVAFRSAGGNAACAVSWESPDPEASGPPEDPGPDPDPEPTPAPSAEAESEVGTD